MSPFARALLVAALAAAVPAGWGCAGCAPSVAQDAGTDAGGDDVDAGSKKDAGAPADGGDGGVVKPPDAGPPFKTGYADEPCPDASYVFDGPDGGFPDGTVTRGLCIAVTTLSGTAELDKAPVQAPVDLTFDGIEYRSSYPVPVDGAGNYAVRVMRARYDRLLFHPTELLNHQGPKDFGAVDLRKDQTRNLSAQTWYVSGSTFFAGQPWPSTANPPDTTIVTEGLQSQQAFAQSVGGTYLVRLLEGGFAYKVSVPFESLGETELQKFEVRPWVDLKEDLTVDIDLPTSELSGNLTIDGEAFPDRLPNLPDYRLEYVAAGDSEYTVRTNHQGGQAYYSALVPKGVYSINLDIQEATDPHLPSQVYNKQLAVQVDLNQNRRLDFNLTTYKVEGALQIDGAPVPPRPSYNWNMYAYSVTLPSQPWFVAYYRVPLTSAAFNLRALPGTYYLYLYLDGGLAEDLAEGWFSVAEQMDIFKDVTLPIDIPTNYVEGTLFVDGVPAQALNGSVGTLTFESADGYFRYRLNTKDGTFRVRLPKAKYDVSFEIDGQSYPDYAVGRTFLGASIDLTGDKPQTGVNLRYQTVPVGGPFLFAGTALPDALGLLPEASLTLQPTASFASYTKALEGGRPWYFLRIPKGAYKLTFELKGGVLTGVASGTAPIGNNLLIDVP